VLFFFQLFSVGRGVCGGCGFCYGSTCNLFVICERGHEVRVRVWLTVVGLVAGCWFWFLVPVLVLWLSVVCCLLSCAWSLWSVAVAGAVARVARCVVCVCVCACVVVVLCFVFFPGLKHETKKLSASLHHTEKTAFITCVPVAAQSTPPYL
jgi:hypothetical protein